MADMLFAPVYSTSAGVIGQNVIALKDTGGDNDQATATGIAELWQEFISGSICQEVQVDGSPRFLYPAEAPTDELIANTSGDAGGSTGDLAPLNSCYSIRISAGYGRRKRGRIFVPGVDEGKVNDGGVLLPQTVIDILSNVGTFNLDMTTDFGFSLGVYSRLDGLVRVATSIQVPGVISTQRRRMYAL